MSLNWKKVFGIAPYVGVVNPNVVDSITEQMRAAIGAYETGGYMRTDNKGQLFTMFTTVNGFMAEFPSGAVVVGLTLSECVNAAVGYATQQAVENIEVAKQPKDDEGWMRIQKAFAK